MMKNLRYFFVASLAMVFGNVMAQEVTLDFTTNDGWNFPTSKTVDEASFSKGGYEIKVKGGGSSNGYYFFTNTYVDPNYSCLMLGKTNATLTLPAFTFAVEKIEVEGGSGASTAVKQNIYVGDAAVSTETTGATATNTYLINKDYQAAGNVYVLKVRSNHNTQITKIKIYKASGVTAPEIAGNELFSGSTQVTITADEGASIYYTTDGVDPTSNSIPYTAPFTIENSCVVKAVASKGGVLSAVASKSFYLTVGDGSEANPLTVADLLSLPNGFTSKGKWVKGIIIGSIKDNAIEETPSVNSNLALAATAGETEFPKVIGIQLVAEKNREALNVVDNPTNIGKELAILGDIETYFTKLGLKNTSDYKLGASGIEAVKANTKFEGKMYNVAGQVVNKGYKGLVIMNGRKFVQK